MANRVKYSISVTPIETIKRAIAYTEEEKDGVFEDVTATDYDVVATEIGRSFGGNGAVDVTNYEGASATQGIHNRTINYGNAQYSGPVPFTTESTASFVFIKNTGKVFSTVTTLGSPSDYSVVVTVGSVRLAVLDSGEAIALKDNNAGIVASNLRVEAIGANGSTGATENVAIEYLVVD